jgi:hypothetical protein
MEGRCPQTVYAELPKNEETHFSASISAIKGRSARARILLLLHGFVIYDVMGLTLSRAVALVQAK